VERTSDHRNSLPDAGQLRLPKSASAILRRSRYFNYLAIELSVNPIVASIEYVESLVALNGRIRVPVDMLVAEREGGRFAFDIVDDRPVGDLDHEGSLLLALEEHNISLVEVDRAQITQQPRAENCRVIWQNREHPVDDSTAATIVRALGHGPVSVEQLGEIAQVSHPLKVICALAWRAVVRIDISRPLNADALVARQTDRQALPSTSESPRRPG